MLDIEGASVVKERISGMSTNKDVKQARTYDARTTEEVAGMLRNKPEDEEGITKKNLFPVFGVVEGIKKDAHAITNHATGPKATTGRNEILPFPQEKIERLGKSIAAEVISQNQSLFQNQGPQSLKMRRSVSKYFSDELLYEMGSIGARSLDAMEFGIETWPSTLPLSEEQMRGVERRREFMKEVVRECIRVLMENDVFKQLVEYENACFQFIFNVEYGKCFNLAVWLDESDEENKGKSIMDIADDCADSIVIEID